MAKRGEGKEESTNGAGTAKISRAFIHFLVGLVGRASLVSIANAPQGSSRFIFFFVFSFLINFKRSGEDSARCHKWPQKQERTIVCGLHVHAQ